MADLPTSELQEARKALFKKGKRQGYLTFQEISAAIPEDMMSPAERWLLFYSLRAMGIQLLDVDVDVSFKAPLRPMRARMRARATKAGNATRIATTATRRSEPPKRRSLPARHEKSSARSQSLD